jgi:cell division septum initiation protein DivIVA
MKALDEVIDETRKLAEQNQQLMVKLEGLRQHVETISPTIATAEAEKAAGQFSAAAE